MLRGITIPEGKVQGLLLKAAVCYILVLIISLISATINPVLGQPNIIISKTAVPEPVNTGNLLTYTITITNNGSGPAHQVKLVDTIVQLNNPVYRIPPEVEWSEWLGTHTFGTIPHTLPVNTRIVFIRGQVLPSQCSSFTNTAYVNHNANPVYVSASVTTTVIDNINPVITCPPNIAQSANLGFCHAAVTIVPATATDNCGISSVVGTRNDGQPITNPYPVGVTTITWVATDLSGNTRSCTQTVTISDNEIPQITCPNNIVTGTNLGTGACFATVSTPNPVFSDNCQVVSLSWTLTGATTGASSLNGINYVGTRNFNLGLTNVAYRIEDAAGNNTTCAFTVLVVDNQNPVINCVGNRTVNVSGGLCTYTHSGMLWNATGGDNCSVSSITYVLSGATTGSGTTLHGVVFNLGVTTVTWTITDGSGNFSQCSFTVTVNDNQNPTITCPGNQVVSNNAGNCGYTHNSNSWNATANDNCSLNSVVYNLSGATTGTGTTLNGVNFNIGLTTVVWIVTDGSGNTAQCTFTVNVQDSELPTINCQGNKLANTNAGVCTYTHTGTGWDASGSDNCSGHIITYSLSGATQGSGISLHNVAFNLGLTTVTWTITDASGNAAQCSHTVQVSDNENPVINCPGNQVVNTNPGVCTYTHAGVAWNATGSDNCSVTSILYVLGGATAGSGTTLNGVTFNPGLTTVTWTVTDGSGNTAQCSFTVIVEDQENPNITCQGNQVVNTNTGMCTYTHSGMTWNATGSDNCMVSSLTYELSGATTGSGTSLNNVSFNLGTTNVTWTITDGSGNTAVCSYTVTVLDNEQPLIHCTGNHSVAADPGMCTYTHAGTGWNATGSDNCSVSSINYVMSGATTGSGTSLAGVIFNVGTTTITWTVTDGSGNTSQCTRTVTVADLQNPAINCTGNQNVNTETGTCTYTHPGTNWNATGSDNCAVSSITYSLTGSTSGSGTTLQGVTFNLGLTLVTWTIADGNGNTAACSFTVNVADNESPSINCVGDRTAPTNAGQSTYTHIGNSWDATGNDNCPVASIIYVLSGATTGSGTTLNGVTFNWGITTVTWTITDGNGNTAQCSYEVMLEDNENPTINCVNNQTVNTASGVCTFTYIGTGWNATGSDNVAVQSIIYQLTGATTGTGTTLNGVTFNLGSTTVTWIITDINGNTAQCFFVVLVQDNVNPTINCAGNQTVNTGPGTCTYTHSGISWNATGSDNCPVSSIVYQLSGATTGTGTTLHGVSFNLGSTVVTWVITDNSGNTAQCTFTVLVRDNEGPTILCPNNQTVSTNAGTCTYTHTGTGWNAIGNDNCSVSSIVYQLSGATTGSGTTLNGVTFNLGITMVTWTVTDGNGNVAVCSYTVRVIDNENPVINCPASFSRNVNAGQCHASIQWFLLSPTYSDNCGVSTANISWVRTGATTGNGSGLMPNTNFNTGITVVTYTITDNSGNVAQCSFNVTVIDNILPTIFITNKTRNNDPGKCYYRVIGNEFQPTFNDNCPGATILNNYNNSNTLAGATFPVGVTWVTWTVTDASGNTRSRLFSVSVSDNQPPLIVCPPNLLVPCPDNIPDPNTATVNASDNCGFVSVFHHNDTYYGIGVEPGFCPDSIRRTYRAVDAAGNVSYCTHTIRVAAPCGCIICQAQTPHFWVNMTGNCDGVWTSPNVRRAGLCCQATHPQRCVSISVMIDENAIGFFIQMDGAAPPGWYYQVNCQAPRPLGSVLCVPPGIYHTVTICKPGGNRNRYTVRSVCGIGGVKELTARIDCDNIIEIEGVPAHTVQWHNITGNYLHYLNPPSGSLTTTFTPDSLSPSFLQYRVCGGFPANPCAPGGILCDTVNIWVVPPISLAIDPPYPQFCENDPKTIYADVWPIGFYEFHWLDSLGNIVETGMEFTPSAPGSYALAAIDTVSTLPCSYDTLYFDVIFQECITQCPEQYHCHESDIVIYQTVEEFLNAGGAVNFPCGISNASINIVGNPQSNGLSCPETMVYTYMIVDSCGNSDICDVIVRLGDIIPPSFSLPSDTIHCVEDIINATYNPTGVYPVDDLTYPRPDYYLHLPGNTILDLIDLDDNCTAPDNLVITWQVDFGQNGTVDISGSGQLSEPPPIYFPVGTNAIHYTVTDECQNSSGQSLIMVVTNRPDIQDDF